MALDSATKALLQTWAAAAGPNTTPLWQLDVSQAREVVKRKALQREPGPSMARCEDILIPVRDGSSIPARLLVPTEQPRGLLVYVHGGGWVLGELSEFETIGRKLAECTEAAVLLVGYRLAPEHPFPVPLQDTWDALLWANEHKVEITGSDVPLVIAGDSAGGNLAAVVARWTRDQNGPKLAAQVLVYPVTDADFSRPSYQEPENQTLLSAPFMSWFWDRYVDDASMRLQPDASPLRANDLSGLPAAFVVTGEHDILRDEGQAYAAAMADAGVEVEHHEMLGQMHGFFNMPGILPASDQVIERIRSFLDCKLRA
jgi:acetyl esterase